MEQRPASLDRRRLASVTGAEAPVIGVFGSANLDLVVRVQAPPRPGETLFGESFTTVPGGKGLNQAVAAVRAGGAVRFFGAVGEDAFGRQILDLLAAEGIDATVVRRVPGATGTAHITVDASGQNSIIVVPAANLAATADQLDASLPGMGWLVTQLELAADAVGQALRAARRHGVRTVLTPAPARLLGPEFLGHVDLLVPNQLEASTLTGTADPLVAAAELSRLCGDVVVTLGGDGCGWASGGEVIATVPAAAVPVVDTTAAGDTFVGVLVTLLAEGRTVLGAIDAATAAAGIAVGRPGATTSMPRRTEFL